MSWLFSTVDPKAPTFHAVTTGLQDSELVGTLTAEDLEWHQASGFATETQTYYHFLEDGSFLMVQIIHSSIGFLSPTVQLTFKYYNPNTKEQVWRSNNVQNFMTPPPGLDKRSCKSDGFTFTYKPTSADGSAIEHFLLQTNACSDVQVMIKVERSPDAPGWKIGNGPKGGFSYYGSNPDKPDGHVYHSFWPRTQVSGQVVIKGKAIPANGPGMYVHAVMGMRPNLIARRWNFADFQSTEHGGVSAIQMELTTQDEYGRHGKGSGGVKVNFGSLVLSGKLACVTVETIWPDEGPKENAPRISRALHHNCTKDKDTSYDAPQEIEYIWSGPSLLPQAQDNVKAVLKVNIGPPTQMNGLLEKVDVLAEIPALVKTVLSTVTGIKPYIYQWRNDVTLNVTAPDSILPGASSGLDVQGYLFNEASFIS